MTPQRICDTRTSFRCGPSLRQDGTTRIALDGFPYEPVAPTAVVGNFTATRSIAPGYLTVWPSAGEARPDVFDHPISISASKRRANHVVLGAGSERSWSVYTESGSDILFDIDGYFTA